ncbi:GDCCVxC domain-containing (seleno)protein [uncultured Thalassospira sp.]|uniref:GDCCVxC domain-containing (seleno)protein n=1 Tax=uncultured Thalassospira sp. TaxID=404382 RepID=UPI00258E3022|nr:GDCCVxC domain-containing (seleno)protein [uncultured Thalassospira sp.]
MKKTDENRIELTSVLTCPECGHVSTETMPTDACQYFYDCTGCGAVLRPLPGDCCVYCSYGTVPCPPVQLHGKNADCCAPTPSGVPPHD